MIKSVRGATVRAVLRALLIALTVGALLGCGAERAAARQHAEAVGPAERLRGALGPRHPPASAFAKASRTADAPSSTRSAPRASPQAPNGPPLMGTAAPTAAGGEGSTAEGEADPLVSNGLDSPLCKGALGTGELPGASRSNCETSGFVAAPAPTGDYGIDVHIDTGVLGLSSGGLLTAVQDLLVTPLWMALVWAVHAIVVMLEWCFTIDLLNSGSVGDGVARGLREMQSAFTTPWLATVLSVASVLGAYNGLVRRRIAETVGQAVLVLAMMAGGLWVMLDPTGTVGALGGWANQASLGTLAVSARGTPAHAGGALADGMGAVFATAIEVPWCYLEFGDVGWCRNPGRLDPALRAAALTIATGELALVGCKLKSVSASLCAPRGGVRAEALERSARLLRAAQSNGAVFLALPANGPARNGISDQGSLLRVICQSDIASDCRGPAAAEAEFRTNGGTWSRVGGLLLIAAGLLGMMLLLGFLALRLLAAALLSLLYLMLTPAAVLAPALGEEGRAVFRKWAAQLLSAVVSKLLFSLLLGVVLAILAILADLEGLGWWTQWLLMSAFWWGAFARRHQALQVAQGTVGRERLRDGRSVGRRVSDALDSPRRAIAGARAAKGRLAKGPPDIDRPRKLVQGAARRAEVATRDQAMRTLEHDRRDARERTAVAPQARERVSAMRAQLQRVSGEHRRAAAGGDSRRTAELANRARRIEASIEREQQAINSAREATGGGQGPRGSARAEFGARQVEERERLLDDQAALPASGAPSGRGTERRRDYVALSGLAGYGRAEYERLAPREQRAARLEIDRELALHRELGASAADVQAGTAAEGLNRRERRDASRAFDRALEERMRARGDGMPRAVSRARSGRSERERPREQRPAQRGLRAQEESSVMRDAREVASGRKRQLGRDRR